MQFQLLEDGIELSSHYLILEVRITVFQLIAALLHLNYMNWSDDLNIRFDRTQILETQKILENKPYPP